MTDGQSGEETVRVLDLYCGAGGVGRALDDLNGVEHVGVDIKDYSDEYAGEFLQGDASEFVGGGFDLVWASPPCTAYSTLSATHYGSAEAALDECPTIPELNVREIAQRAGREYVVENVPGATRQGHLHDPARLNGLAFGQSYDLTRHFETSFPLPDAYEAGTPDVGVRTRDDDDQSVKALADAKAVPASWGKQAVRSAIPREYVYWVLSHSETVDAPRPPRSQKTLDEVTA